jgi:hypothetical protein
MRAIRKRYFARSAGETSDQPFSNASRAALTARSTSCSVAWPTSARAPSLEGSMVVYDSFGSSQSPPTKSP